MNREHRRGGRGVVGSCRPYSPLAASSASKASVDRGQVPDRRMDRLRASSDPLPPHRPGVSCCRPTRALGLHGRL